MEMNNKTLEINKNYELELDKQNKNFLIQEEKMKEEANQKVAEFELKKELKKN